MVVSMEGIPEKDRIGFGKLVAVDTEIVQTEGTRWRCGTREASEMCYRRG
jgi:hypothetical protein